MKHARVAYAGAIHNAFERDELAPGVTDRQAQFTLSDLGTHFLAGLLAHARGMAVLCTPTANGFARFRPNALAPQDGNSIAARRR